MEYGVARISLKIGGGKSTRFQTGGKNQEEAILKLLEKVELFIITITNSGSMTLKINANLPNLLIKSINNLHILDPKIAEKTLQIVNTINGFNAKLDNIIAINSNIVPFSMVQNSISNISTIPQLPTREYENQILETSKQTIKSETYIIEDLGIEWKSYELSLCVKTAENPKPLSQKTVDSYIYNWNKIILLFLKKNKKLYINQINEEIIKDLLKDIKYYDGKRLSYITLGEFFKYLGKQKNIICNVMANIDKPIRPPKDEEDDIVCIEPENQNIYLDIFEKDNSDMTLLFETMLLTGIRPEEACGLKWCAVDIENKRFDINNAYKDFIVYDENIKPIGHERKDDRLKTEESYRKIPINDRLMNNLLKHKEEQKLLFKNSRAIKKRNRKWAENEYVFLGRTYRPYVSETLSKGMSKFRKKYNLEKNITPYGLRYSFATYWAEKGIDKNALMHLMRSCYIFNHMQTLY